MLGSFTSHYHIPLHSSTCDVLMFCAGSLHPAEVQAVIRSLLPAWVLFCTMRCCRFEQCAHGGGVFIFVSALLFACSLCSSTLPRTQRACTMRLRLHTSVPYFNRLRFRWNVLHFAFRVVNCVSQVARFAILCLCFLCCIAFIVATMR